MNFFDQVQVSLKSGKGWDGLVAARRESWAAFWWPSWGNGWKGWDVIFVGSKDLWTLIDFRQNKVYTANDGEDGRTKDQYWANADDIYMVVPQGTIIKDAKTGRIIAQILHDKQKYLAAKWGKGGIWNMHFKNSVNQYPNFALLWEPAQLKNLILELQLLWDVGLIGTPSVGKSTLINAVSNVKAKTAEYHFTTLVPNLGSVKVWTMSFNMVDIPGLIAWASEWKWLWNDFLKHVLKSQVFTLIADLSRYESGIVELIEILDEIVLYIEKRFSNSPELWTDISDIYFTMEATKQNHIKLAVFWKDDTWEEHLLFEKILHFVFSKQDLVSDEEIIKEFKSEFFEKISKYLQDTFSFKLTKKLFETNTFVVSAANQYGTNDWLHYLADLLINEEVKHLALIEKAKIWVQMIVPIKDITDTEKPKLVHQWYLQEWASKNAKVWLIDDPDFSRLSFQTPWWNEEAMLWFWKVIDREGFTKMFDRYKVLPWDILKVKSHYDWNDDRYIMYTL